MSRDHRFTVPPEAAGQRLDRWLTAAGPSWTRSAVQRFIAGGHVAVDGEVVLRAAHRLAGGEEVQVHEPEPRPSDLEPQAMELEILYEDSEILALNKPAGVVVHPAAGNPDGTLVNALLHHCRDLSGIGGAERPGIVHRLDKDTTGVMVVAKTDRAHLALSRAFQWRTTEKTYLALVYGLPHPAEGVVDAPIGRHPRERKRMAVVPEGRPARTLYTVAERFPGLSLLHCRLITGRTHQVRVHMAHIGHALVGDPLYAGRQWRNLEEPLRFLCRSFPRQVLHAWRLALDHPVTGERLELEAPLPADLESLLTSLRSQSG
jgi:23S rRNA pseudouridine1911/1915/1917 synthase